MWKKNMTSANRHKHVYTLYHHIKHTSIQHMASANIHMCIPYIIKYDIGNQHMTLTTHSIHHMTAITWNTYSISKHTYVYIYVPL